MRSISAAVLVLALTSCTDAPDSSTQPGNVAAGAPSSGGATSLAGSGGLGGTGGSDALQAAGGSGGSLAGSGGGTMMTIPEPDAGVAGMADAATADASDEPTPIVCPTPALNPGDHQASIEHGGRSRSYVMHVPNAYLGGSPVPLVFDFHGYGSSGRGQMGASGFAELSDQHGFVVVYPDGVGGSWHVNGCCGQAAQEDLDEISFVRAVLADVTAKVCVDPLRVYASGISQGGGMAHHVACLAADVFAAVAPVSSDLRTEPCEPSRPVSELSFRGMADNLSPYEGGPVGPVGMQYQAIGARATLERWATINGCTGAPEPMLELCETHAQCMDGVEVMLCSIPGGGHILYSNPSSFDIASTAWAMFERQARKR